MDITEQANKNTEEFGKAQGNFYDELDRLEETNKKLHKQIKDLKWAAGVLNRECLDVACRTQQDRREYDKAMKVLGL